MHKIVKFVAIAGKHWYSQR